MLVCPLEDILSGALDLRLLFKYTSNYSVLGERDGIKYTIQPIFWGVLVVLDSNGSIIHLKDQRANRVVDGPMTWEEAQRWTTG